MLALADLLWPDEDSVEELFQLVAYPLKDKFAPKFGGKKFIFSDHNRDGESHRSPWSNTYRPPIRNNVQHGFAPSHNLRQLEIQANEVFDCYRELYYGKGAISSVYLWDKFDEASGFDISCGFSGFFLVNKTIVDEVNSMKGGFWNSIHVVDVGGVADGRAIYKLTTTVLFSMDLAGNGKNENINFGGSLSRQVEKCCAVSCENVNMTSSHIVTIGKMIEDVEIDIRSSIDALYFQKSKEVLDNIWISSDGYGKLQVMATLMTQNKNNAIITLNEAVLAHGSKKR